MRHSSRLLVAAFSLLLLLFAFPQQAMAQSAACSAVNADFGSGALQTFDPPTGGLEEIDEAYGPIYDGLDFEEGETIHWSAASSAAGDENIYFSLQTDGTTVYFDSAGGNDFDESGSFEMDAASGGILTVYALVDNLTQSPPSSLNFQISCEGLPPPATTETVVTASPNPAVTGQSVTLSATVSVVAPGTGTPTGTVTFTAPSGLSSTVPLNGAGVATTTMTASASETITATYNGDTGFTGSFGTTALTVNAAATTTTLDATPNPAVTGQSVTLSATVAVDAPGTGTPTGTVTFTAPSGLSNTVALNGAGVATTTMTASSSETITATYDGDTGFGSSLDTASLTVNAASTTTTLDATPNPAVTGQSVRVSATVAVDAPGTGTPTGTVTFTAPSGLSDTVTLDGAGTATTTLTASTSETITATYNGGTGFAGSFDTANLTVNPASTTTLLTPSPSTAVTGEAVTLSATVAVDAPGTGTPTGTVTFTAPSGLSDTVSLDGAGTATTTLTASASEIITATYNGDTGFAGSFGTTNLTVNPASTTTAVSASPNPAVLGQTVTVSVTVAPVAPGTGTPTGDVTFTAPSGLSETVTLDGSGEASTTLTASASETITATYSGDTGFAGSFGTANLTVNPASTTTVVSASPNPAVSGQTVTVSAAVAVVAPGTGTPTGTVIFTAPSGLSETVTLDGSGEASTTLTASASETITATYDGAAGFAGSEGETILAVDEAATTTAVTASPNPAVFGQTVTLSATVSVVAPGTGTPTGTVTFTAPSGLSETVTLDGSGGASTTLTAATSETITATYNGATGFAGSIGTASLAVDEAMTTTTVSASPNPAVTGQTVTVSATVAVVAPGTGTPTGTVTFTAPSGLSETVSLDGSGAATTTLTASASETITATYNGATGLAGSSGTASLAVDAATTTTTVSATPNPAISGQTVTLSATVAVAAPGTGTPTGTVTFTAPSGLSDTVTLDAGGVATTTLTASVSETITATYNGATGFTGSSGTSALTVEAATTTTTVSAAPNPATSGQTVTLSATVAVVAPGTGTPTGTVTFTAPSGLSATVALDGSGLATTTMTASASETITATYDGATGFMTSSNSVALAVLSTDATLAALVPSAGSLEPGFSSGTIAYEVDVANETETIRFTPTAAGPGAQIAVNGQSVASGAASEPIAIAVGDNQIDIVVTAQDGVTVRTYTVTVARAAITRPDPSLDPEVIGLLNAQASTARRFARNQMRNFHSRLEQLHNEGDRRASSMNVRLGITQANPSSPAERQIERMIATGRDGTQAGTPPELLSYGSAGTRVSGAHGDATGEGDAQASPFAGPDLGPFAVWSGGFVNFGERDSGGLDLDYTMVGVSSGLDYRFSERFVGGFGVGYGRDRTDIGSNGTESRASAFSAAVYGSYKPIDNLFIDGLLGGSWMDFDSRRFVTANGEFADGTRSGKQLFGSVSAAYEFRDETWLVSPYGRAEFSRSWLDGFTETGGGIYGLTYGDQTIDTLSGVLGVRASYGFEMGWGTLTPGVRAEYTHDFEGSSRASLGYTDLGGLPYSVDVDPDSRDYVTLGLSLDMSFDLDWNLGFDYRTSLDGSSNQDHAVAARLTRRF